MEKVLAMPKVGGGHNTFVGSFKPATSFSYPGEWYFFPFNRKERKVLPCLKLGGGGSQHVSDLQLT